jgi:putative MFS transporter
VEEIMSTIATVAGEPPAVRTAASSDRSLQAQLDAMPLNPRHWLVFAFCSAGMLFDSLDLQLMSFAAPHIMNEWALTPERLGAVISAAVFGMIVGTYLFGAIADGVGRRMAFQITIGVFSIFTGLAALTWTLGQLALVRFAAGLGIGGSIPVDAIVLSEFIPNRSRGRMMALWAISFSVGGLIAPLCAWLILPEFGWRGLFVVGAAPAFLLFLIRWLIPESPVYLLMRGRMDEAKRAIGWIAGSQDVKIELGLPSAAPSSPSAPKVSILELFSPELRKQTLLSWLIWFGWGFSYFGLILWLPTLLAKYRGVAQTDVLTFMVGFAIAGIAGRLGTLFLVDRWGRKPIIVGCGAFAFLAMMIFAQQTGYPQLLLWGYVTAFFLDGGFSAIVPYIPELYPTRARGTGVGAAQGTGRVASALAPIVVGFTINTAGVGTVFMLLAVGAMVTALATLVLGIETKGTSLGT